MKRFILYFFILTIGCHQEVDKFRPYKIAGAIDLCAHNKYFDKAYEIYLVEKHNYPQLDNYINKLVAIKLFSEIGNTKLYEIALANFLYGGGEINSALKHTSDKFAKAHSDLILQIEQKNNHYLPEIEGEIEKITKLFLEQDRFIRTDYKGTKREKIILDSINQINLKVLINDKSSINYKLLPSLNLLLRHASKEYLDFFKSSGLLNHYSSNGLLPLERYYDAYGYVTGFEFFPYNSMSGKDNEKELNRRRKQVGLLPIKFSPLFYKKSDNELNFPNRTEKDRRELCDDLVKFLNIKI